MNPLLERCYPIPFDRVRAEHVGPAVEELLADARARMRAIESDPGPRTFESTLLALEAVTERLEHAMNVVAHLEATATTDALRDAYNAAQPLVSELETSIPLSPGLWQAVRSFAASDEAASLTGPRARFLDKTVAYFRRHGAELDTAGKVRLGAIDVELTKLTLRYAQNVLDSSNTFELCVVDEARLAGLPQSARLAARESARSKGMAGWRFTLQAPSYVPALTYLDDASLRETIYRAVFARATRGAYDNAPIVARVLALRRERARLLGYESFADLVLEERMAKTGAAARAFVDDLRARTEAAFAAETRELQAFRDELEGKHQPLMAWDVGYYSEKLRQKLYSFDEEQLRPYFRFSSVLQGLFEIVGRLFGLRFEPDPEAPRWDERVTAYRVVEEPATAIASIYVDPYPRENKHAGAWMDGILGRATVEADRRHVGILVANLTPPLGAAEAELTHRDVETLFHEFGHLMHHCLGRAAIRSQTGTRVAWDFVELPSQMMENWCWEREAVDLFARHRDTGDAIPDALLSAMQRARRFRAASGQMRQLGFAAADLALHMDYQEERDGDAIAYGRAIIERHSPTALPADHAMMASFDHLFGNPVGYAAAYYSYKWAEVLDADAFTRFKREGLFSRAVGMEFRQRVLARGDQDDPALLYRDFMGRDPELWPLLERLGLEVTP